MPAWLEVASGVTAALALLLGSIAVIYRKAIRPVTRGIAQLVETVPTIVEIAEQFKPDHGTSLMDVVTDMRDDIKELKDDTKKLQGDLIEVVGKQAELNDKQLGFERYVHDFVHDTRNVLTVVQGTLHLQEERAKRPPTARTRATDKES